MAKKNNIAAVLTLNLVALASIVAAGEAGTFAPLVEIEGLEQTDPALVEINREAVDAHGYVAVRATAAGIAKAAETVAAPVVTAEVSSKFAVVDVPSDLLEMANSNKRSPRGGGEKYPFGELEIGKGFFIPATAKMPEPHKSLASTVSSAMARYAVETGEQKLATVKEYATDANGKRVKDGEGHFVVVGETEQMKPVMENTRVFKLVNATGAEKGAWVIRTA